MTGPKDKPGIIPRAMYLLYDIAKREKVHYKCSIKCYMLELYNDTLVDLLQSPKEGASKLAIKKDEKVDIATTFMIQREWFTFKI
jgi:hypothetical protein